MAVTVIEKQEPKNEGSRWIQPLAHSCRVSGLPGAACGQAAFGPQQAVVFAEQDDRYRDLAAGVEEAWKAQVGAAGWHRTDLEGTVSFVSDGNKLTTP